MSYKLLTEQRERREFIYRHMIENEQRAKEEKKRKLRTAVDENTAIPTDLRKDALDIHKTLAYDDEGADGITSLNDDEYKWAGVEDPKILITTSRDPSSRLKTFAKEVRLIFPNSLKINRGGHGIDRLVELCTNDDFTDLIILEEYRGNPDSMIISHMPHGPTAFFNLSNVVFRSDIENKKQMSEEYPHLLFHEFGTKLAQRVHDILKNLFPVPKEDSRRVMTFYQKDDFIMFRHNVFSKDKESQRIKTTEVGPRFNMFCFKILLGRIDQKDTADYEWQYAPYKRTAKKQKLYSI